MNRYVTVIVNGTFKWTVFGAQTTLLQCTSPSNEQTPQTFAHHRLNAIVSIGERDHCTRDHVLINCVHWRERPLYSRPCPYQLCPLERETTVLETMSLSIVSIGERDHCTRDHVLINDADATSDLAI